MSFLPTASPPLFRPPSNTPHPKSAEPSKFQAPPGELFIGEWYNIRSSNGFWKDKRNVRVKYSPTESGSYMENEASYQTTNSDNVKTMVGRDTPYEGNTGTYTWQGKGFLRVASARWEILCFTKRPDCGDWMLIYVHKTIFANAAINLMCRSREGLGEEDLKFLAKWLEEIEDGAFQQAVRGMVDIKQE